ncbi:hypothetical protein BXT92_02205 [Klebsiella pneumoniae]|nr:hypothetical protein BXT92_02205 [Klebsiella pneumoniae]
MTLSLRTRDPGLQPERTALAWQRTLFSVFVLALASTRFGFARGDLVSGGIAGIALGLTVILAIVVQQRQVGGNTALTTFASVMIKRLLSVVLGLEAISLVLSAVLSLLREGVV